MDLSDELLCESASPSVCVSIAGCAGGNLMDMDSEGRGGVNKDNDDDAADNKASDKDDTVAELTPHANSKEARGQEDDDAVAELTLEELSITKAFTARNDEVHNITHGLVHLVRSADAERAANALLDLVAASTAAAASSSSSSPPPPNPLALAIGAAAAARELDAFDDDAPMTSAMNRGRRAPRITARDKGDDAADERARRFHLAACASPGVPTQLALAPLTAAANIEVEEVPISEEA
jgi:hypothetical protein